MTEKVTAVGAQRQANREFSLPRQRACQQQICQIGADDDQHTERGSTQAFEQQARFRRKFVAQGNTDKSTASFSFGYCFRSRAAISNNSLRAWASETPGFSRPMPSSNYLHGPVVRFLKTKGRPEERFARGKEKVGRHDSDHCIRLVIERDRLADDFLDRLRTLFATRNSCSTTVPGAPAWPSSW